MNKSIVIFLISILMLLNCGIGFSFGDSVVDEPIIYFEKGQVLFVENKTEEGDFSYDYQLVDIKIKTGKYKDEIVKVENALSGNELYDFKVKPNERVLLYIEDFGDSKVVNITDYERDSIIKILIIVFLAMLVIVGKKKGLKSVLTITFTVLSIFKIFIPMILKGYNPLIITIFISILITIITITVISGFHKKSFAAIIGTIIGVVIAGIISIIVSKLIKLTGMSTEEAGMLINLPQEIHFDFRNLLFSGIILGALGAIMDVAMSMASAIQEIHNANNNLTISELFSSGMEVGRDIMGTMSNTLILAYTGSFIPLLLLFAAYDMPFMRMINMDIIATEIIRSLAGSIGLILTIPITALFAVTFLKRDEFN